MKSSFCIDLQRFMLIPTKFPLSRFLDNAHAEHTKKKSPVNLAIYRTLCGERGTKTRNPF